jgi:hypothetical protein
MRCLAAKKSVDDRALNWQVWQRDGDQKRAGSGACPTIASSPRLHRSPTPERFVADSPVEQAGFELLVPLVKATRKLRGRSTAKLNQEVWPFRRLQIPAVPGARYSNAEQQARRRLCPRGRPKHVTDPTKSSRVVPLALKGFASLAVNLHQMIFYGFRLLASFYRC